MQIHLLEGTKLHRLWFHFQILVLQLCMLPLQTFARDWNWKLQLNVWKRHRQVWGKEWKEQNWNEEKDEESLHI